MFPYERVVQWAAGPVSAGIGLLATDVMHQNISKSSALAVATFALSSASTYLAHHKWLDNLAKWWDKEPAGLRQDAEEAGKVLGPDIEKEAEAIFNEITAQSAAAEKVQGQSGTPESEIVHGLSPSPAAQPTSIPPQG